MTQAVRILESVLVQAPVVVGWLRPVILLPAAAIAGLTPMQLEAILAHELAHIRRHDYLVNLLQAVVETLIFYHPAVWWLSRNVRHERELCCDDVALAVCSNRIGYAEALSAVAEMQLTGPAVAMSGTGGDELLGRIGRVLGVGSPGPRPGERMAAGLLVLVGLSGMAAGLLLPTRAQGQSTAPTTPAATYLPIGPDSKPTSDITGVVKDESGRPVAGATVLAVRGWESPSERRTAITDAEGRFSFSQLKPDGDWHYSVNDPRYGWEWDHERGHMVPVGPEELPVKITLYKARKLKGAVVDDAGKPVPGVRVVLVNQVLPGRSRPVSGHINDDFVVTQTDSDGRFAMERLRPGRAQFVLEHPEYSNTFVNDVTVDRDEQDVVLKIDKGLTLHGRVVHDGKPVAGVNLHAGIAEAHRSMLDWKGESDANGEFEVPHVRALPFGEREGCVLSFGLGVDDPQWKSAYYNVYQTGKRELPPVTVEVYPSNKEKDARLGAIDVGKKNTLDAAGRNQAATRGTITARLSSVPKGSVMVFLTSLAPGENVYSTFQAAAQGRTVFESVSPGRYMVSVGITGDESDGNAWPPKAVELEKGQKLEVTLEPGPGRLRGVVRSAGKPVTGGWLCWFAAPPIRRAVFQGGTQIASDGSYSFSGFSEGTYQLVYQAPNSMTNWFEDIAVSKGQMAHDIELPASRIEGKLVGLTPKKNPNRPIGEIFVRPSGIPPMLANSGVFVDADADGRFAVEHLKPGRYLVSGYGCATTVTVERADSVVSVTLQKPEKTGEIAGTVSGNIPSTSMDGSDSIQLTAFPKNENGYEFGEWTYSTTCNPNTGGYGLRNLPPGVYGIWVTQVGPMSAMPRVWISNVEVRQGLSRDVQIVLPDGRRVSVSVQDRTHPDLPVVQCMGWRVRMPSGDWLDKTVLLGSAPEGQFALPLGEYVFEVEYRGRGKVTKKVVLERGEGVQEVVIRPAG